MTDVNSGLILFNKPTGVTSFDALRDIKRSLGTGKVGHTGTLDKFASGLLIVLVGKALRLSQWFTHCDKKYIGKIRFGEETDTLDPEGKVVAEAALPLREDVEKVLEQFTGRIMQAPPAYSAIHVNGKRASDLTRSGKEIEMKKREVTIYKIELRVWEPPFAEIFVHCSSGTYIRSLARDIALAVNSRGYLCELKRTQVGGFKLEREEIHTKTQSTQRHEVKPISKEVISNIGLTHFEVDSSVKEKILHGKSISFVPRTFGSTCLSENSSCLAIFEGSSPIAIIEKDGANWKYACVLG